MPAAQVAVRLQHHPSRASLLPGLLARLAGFDDVEVITDPGGPRPSSWRTHRLCLEALPPEATHLLVIQDDALPCRDFHARARDAIAAHPTRLLCLFTPGFGHLARRLFLAQRAGDQYVELPVSTFVPLVGIIYPREHAEAIPVYADSRRMPTSRADDAVVAAYVRAHRLGAIATVPSLVEHLDGEPSVMMMRARPGQRHRVAALYADA